MVPYACQDALSCGILKFDFNLVFKVNSNVLHCRKCI